MSGKAILIVGDVMRDVVVRLGGPIRRGTDQRAAITTMPGGSAANLAAWLARAGCPVRLLACVSHADLAAERERIAGLGVEPALVSHPTLPTGALVALVDSDGERSFLTDRGANDALAVEDLPQGVLDDVGHLHVSGYAFVGAATRATAVDLLTRALSLGVSTSLDPGSAGDVADLGAGAVLGWSRGIGLCVANTDEAEALTGAHDPEAQLTALGVMFDLVVLKRGAAGAMAGCRDGRRWEMPAVKVAMTDTIGAGDAFLAGFLAARHSGASIEVCLARAVALGSLATTLAGGLPPSGA